MVLNVADSFVSYIYVVALLCMLALTVQPNTSIAVVGFDLVVVLDQTFKLLPKISPVMFILLKCPDLCSKKLYGSC